MPRGEDARAKHRKEDSHPGRRMPTPPAADPLRRAGHHDPGFLGRRPGESIDQKSEETEWPITPCRTAENRSTRLPRRRRDSLASRPRSRQGPTRPRHRRVRCATWDRQDGRRHLLRRRTQDEHACPGPSRAPARPMDEPARVISWHRHQGCRAGRSAGKTKPNGRLDVAMVQGLVCKGSVSDLVAGYGQVIGMKPKVRREVIANSPPSRTGKNGCLSLPGDTSARALAMRVSIPCFWCSPCRGRARPSSAPEGFADCILARPGSTSRITWIRRCRC
jgi:hypothetical protein